MTIEEFAQRVQEGERSSLRKSNMACQANLDNTVASIKPGRKWTKVDVGHSGKYMVDREGHIYGIKAYGVPNYGHYFGTLDSPRPECFRGLWG